MVPLRVVFGPSSSPQAGTEQVPIMHEVCWHSRFPVQSPVLELPPVPVAVDVPPAPLAGEPPAPLEVPPVPVGFPGFCLTPAQAPTVKTKAAAAAANRWRSMHDGCPEGPATARRSRSADADRYVDSLIAAIAASSAGITALSFGRPAARLLARTRSIGSTRSVVSDVTPTSIEAAYSDLKSRKPRPGPENSGGSFLHTNVAPTF